MKNKRFFFAMLSAGLLAIAALGLSSSRTARAEQPPKAAAPAPVAAAATPSPEDPARLALPLAKIGARTLNLEYMESTLLRQSPLVKRDLLDPAKRREYLDKLIDAEVLADESQRRGYDKNSEVVSVRKNQLASLMHRRIAEATTDAEPTEEALRKYYDENADDYHKPEKARARHILLKDKAEAQKLLAEIKKNKMSQHEFRRLAQERSEDEETKLRGGDLTFFTRPAEAKEGDPKIDPAIAEATFKIKETGDVAPELVQTEKGYHIVMRTGRREKMDLKFEDAKERLVALVKREDRRTAIETQVKALEQKFPVQLFEENLKYVVIDLSSPGPEGPMGMEAGNPDGTEPAHPRPTPAPSGEAPQGDAAGQKN
ncbi:MAG: peptidyl-prolyl cis-trans isomerase [Myxococcota bacterium]|jgi:peptidyl-prolyl cis-trans isomerase C|nr:peptidyl-prolyl cis-trans isomerase [Myxococcota bacterium]